jgi:hypothetical protein
MEKMRIAISVIARPLYDLLKLPLTELLTGFIARIVLKM